MFYLKKFLQWGRQWYVEGVVYLAKALLHLPINLLQFLELHQVAVDLVLLERFIVHREREINLKRLLNFLFYFQKAVNKAPGSWYGATHRLE